MKKVREKETDTIPTVKQIHNAFYKEVCSPLSGKEVKALEKSGFELVPPVEYSSLFPFHKLIHINRIILLCEKYNLLFANTSDFVGAIPKKSIEEIERFVSNYNYVHLLKEEEDCLFTFWGNKKEEEHRFVKEVDSERFKYDSKKSVFRWHIAAPEDMIVTNKKRKRTIHVPDPIVIAMIQPRHHRYEAEKWGIIVSAWGEEASDEIVVNERNN